MCIYKYKCKCKYTCKCKCKRKRKCKCIILRNTHRRPSTLTNVFTVSKERKRESPLHASGWVAYVDRMIITKHVNASPSQLDDIGIGDGVGGVVVMAFVLMAFVVVPNAENRRRSSADSVLCFDCASDSVGLIPRSSRILPCGVPPVL
eukprot:m.72128 g.72128  ORF g.72128 m.72128 type:complete len:148 (+) comp24429_c0_seq3:184-627(+)